MIITELAERSAVPPATIKYYVREGLLPPGRRVSQKSTEYTEEHLQRLRLVRAMLEVGKLSTSSVLDVLAALDSPGLDIIYALEAAQRALTRSVVTSTSEPSTEALHRIDAVAERAGWGDCADNIGRGIAARAIDAAEMAGVHLEDDYLDSYATGANTIAQADMGALQGLPDRSSIVHVMVIGTVLGDPLSAGLRRIAQEHYANLGSH